MREDEGDEDRESCRMNELHYAFMNGCHHCRDHGARAERETVKSSGHFVKARKQE